MDTPLLEEAIKNDSTQHMHAGISFLERGLWEPALKHFDEAIRLREQLTWQEDVLSAWLLAAAWLNRSDVLRLQGKPELYGESLHALDLCMRAMAHVPLEENAAYPERLILAWVNRGTLLGEMEDPAKALHAFSTAESLLQQWGSNVTPQRCLLRVMLRTNRARFHLIHAQPLPALEDTQTALGILAQIQATSAAIKVRSLQCRALAMLLDEPDGADHFEDWIALATDTTEEALALVKASGYVDFWVSDLVRYGAKIYRICQPHFLAEFISDWMGDGPLAGDQALRSEMRNELLLAQFELEQRVLASSGDTEYVHKQIEILKTLQEGVLRIRIDA